MTRKIAITQWAALIILLTGIFGSSLEPARAQEQKENCKQDGTITICAVHASISAESRSGQSLEIDASLSIVISNNGSLPITLFASYDNAAFLPDRGPEIAGVLQVRGLPSCNSTPQSCLSSSAFVPLRLAPHSDSNIEAHVSERLDRDNVARIASAKTVVFSGDIYVLDADQHLSRMSISLPVLSLDNGLTGF